MKMITFDNGSGRMRWSRVLCGAAVVLLATLIVVASKSAAAGPDPAQGYFDKELTTGTPILHVYIRRHGFENDRLTVRSGPKRIVVTNISTMDDLHFTVTREGVGEVFSGSIDNGVTRHALVPFEPGELIVREASHPEWECRITIVP